MNNNIGLVVEGGGMRVVYAVGVLEKFLQHKIYFPYLVGVSAGASNGANYVSRQSGRGLRVNIDYLKNYRYMSTRNFLLHGSYIGMDFIFDKIPHQLDPFDFKTFHSSSTKYFAGTTDCQTGEAVFFGKEDVKEKLEVLRATVSLPVICPIVKFKGYELLDGGIAMPIPLDKSIADGNTKHVIVLSRARGYTKKGIDKVKPFLNLWYKKYPKLVECILTRHERYNQTLNKIEELEKAGKLFVIQPQTPPQVSRLSKNKADLIALHNQAMQDTENLLPKLMEFVSG